MSLIKLSDLSRGGSDAINSVKPLHDTRNLITDSNGSIWLKTGSVIEDTTGLYPLATKSIPTGGRTGITIDISTLGLGTSRVFGIAEEGDNLWIGHVESLNSPSVVYLSKFDSNYNLVTNYNISTSTTWGEPSDICFGAGLIHVLNRSLSADPTDDDEILQFSLSGVLQNTRLIELLGSQGITFDGTRLWTVASGSSVNTLIQRNLDGTATGSTFTTSLAYPPSVLAYNDSLFYTQGRQLSTNSPVSFFDTTGVPTDLNQKFGAVTSSSALEVGSKFVYRVLANNNISVYFLEDTEVVGVIDEQTDLGFPVYLRIG